jgi:hypothetical protein
MLNCKRELFLFYIIEDPATLSAPKARKGRLTEKLLSEGLLTSDMLKQLEKEWIQVASKFRY